MELKTLMQNLSRNTQLQNTNVQNSNVSKNEAVKLALEMFTDGEIVKGEVIDVNNLTAKILTQNGDKINGQLQSRGQLNIGEERQFIVKQDENGNTSFAIVPEEQEVLVNNNISKALKDFGLTADDKTLNLAKELINNNLPVNKETIQTLNRGLALLSGDNESLEKTLLLLKNEMPVNSKNTNLLNNFISKEIKALDNMNNIEATVNNLEDGETKENIIKILNGITENLTDTTKTSEDTLSKNEQINTSDKTSSAVVAEEGDTTDKVVKNNLSKDVETIGTKEQEEKSNNKLIYREKNDVSEEVIAKDKLSRGEKLNLKFSPKELNVKDLEEFLNNTKEKLEEALKELETSKVSGTKELVQQLIIAKDSMEFTSQLKNNLFLQMPLSINNHETNGELLVFNNKSNGKNKNKKATSVIVGLDTVNLGRFETYIKKDDSKIDMQFRLEDDKVVNLVKANINKLEELLKAKNLSIESIQFKKIENPFTLMTKEDNEKTDEQIVNSMKFNIKM